MMKNRLAILIAASAATALGAPVAQAHVQGNWSYAKAAKSAASLKSTSSQTLAAMLAAGTAFHATTKAPQASVRPDDRAGSRGI